jgi:glycosyltransferase involved in cell wall biosynthesis
VSIYKPNRTPKVSIGIPTFNSNHNIVTALSSILNQNYPNMEVIISDNCSTDNTQDIVTNIASSDLRIKYFRQAENIGIFPNFDFVLKKSVGEYFMWVADDDRLEPGIIQKYIDFLRENRDYSLVSGQIKYWDSNSAIYIEKNFNIKQNAPMARVLNYYGKVVYGGMFHGMMRRALLNKIKVRNTIASDWHIVSQMAYMGKLRNLDTIGYHKQFGGSSNNFKTYAKNIGASPIAAHFPFFTIGFDTFRLLAYKSDVYSEIPGIKRILFALRAMFLVFLNHYSVILPKIFGRKFKYPFRRKKVALP